MMSESSRKCEALQMGLDSSTLFILLLFISRVIHEGSSDLLTAEGNGLRPIGYSPCARSGFPR
jgi:hypothetical protein